MWTTKLKIALIEKNTDQLSKLMDEIPQLKDPEEMKEALYLLKEATELVIDLQSDAANSMKQIKKNIKFLKATEAPNHGKLDIKS